MDRWYRVTRSDPIPRSLQRNCNAHGSIHRKLARGGGRHRYFTRCIPLISTAVTLYGGGLEAQQDPPFEDGLIAIDIAAGPSRVVSTLVRDSTILIPVNEVLDLSEIGFSETAPGIRIEGRLEPAGTRFFFDAASGTARRGDESFALEPRDGASRYGILFLRPDVIGRVLGVTVIMDWEELILIVRNTDHLPVVRRLRLERRRELMLRANQPLQPTNLHPPDRTFADGAILDWATTFATKDPANASAFDLGLGMELVGGGLEVRHTQRRTTVGQFNSSRASWIRAWPNGRAVRQLRLGDISSTGPRSNSIRGAVITNSPFVRPSQFGLGELTGTLQPGWTVELYRGESLINYAPVDDAGRYNFAVPIRYGPNPVNLIAYGTHGELTIVRRTFEVPFRRLPRGSFEYGVSGGECTADPCQAALNLDARYGINSLLTVRTGAEAFWRDTLPDVWHPYGAFSAAPVRSFNISAEVVSRAFVTARSELTPTPDFQLILEHTHYMGDVVAPIVGSAVLRNRTGGSLFWRPMRIDRGFFFRLTGSRTQAVSLTRSRIALSGTVRAANSRIEITLSRESERAFEQTARSRTGANALFSTTLSTPLLLRRVFVQTNASVYNDSGLTQVSVELARQISSAARIELATGWERGVRGINFEFAITTSLPSFRAVSRNTYSEFSGLQGTQLIEGSVLWDSRSNRLALGDGRGLGRAGLAGLVFLDANGNGVMDADEQGIPDIRLRIAAHSVTTDSLGRYRIWDLVPFDELRLEIDSMAIENPLWVPAVTTVSTYLEPNSYTQIDLPVVFAAFLSGQVTLAATQQQADGIPLLLTNVATGETMKTTSLSDGAFFIIRVTPGEYTLMPEQRVLDRLGLNAEPVRLVIETGSGEIFIEGIRVELFETGAG